MKFKWIISFVVIFTIIIGYLWLVSFRNNKIDSLPKLSESISESKKEGAFIAQYRVSYISDSVITYLKKHNLSYIDINALDIWVERDYHSYHQFILFKKHTYTEQLRLLIKDPTSLLGENPGFPFIGFKIRNTATYSGEKGMGMQVCALDIGNVAEKSMEIEVYINHSNNEEDEYIGDIRVEQE